MTTTGSRIRSIFAGPTFAPFQHGIFTAIWVSSLVANSGVMIQGVGAAWMMTTIDPSPQYVALVQAANTAPTLLFAMFTGAVADLFDRRRVMLAAQIVTFVVSVSLAALAWFGGLQAWSLLLLTFLIASGRSLYGPAWQASIIEQVPREKLPAAVGLNSVGFNLAQSVAPAVGGAVVAAGGAVMAFMVNTLTYLGLIGVLIRWKNEPVARTMTPERIDRAMWGGLLYVARSRPIRSTLIRGAMMGTCGAAVWSLAPLVAHDLLKAGPVVYGGLLTAFGVGAMLGGLSSVKMRAVFGSVGLMTIAGSAFALAGLVVALSRWFGLTLCAQLVAGCAWVLAASSFNTAVQTSSPRWVAGRAVAFYQMLTFGTMSLGSVLWGQVGRHLGVTGALMVASLVLLVAQAVAWRVLPREEPELDLSPAEVDMPQPHSDVPPSLGPILVAMEYRVDPENAEAFAAAARELGRIRMRDGAADWSILQDLDNPERWIERFIHPTWLEYQRYLTRFTRDDLKVQNALFEFTETPEVSIRRMAER